MDQQTSKGLLGVSQNELIQLFSAKGNPDSKTKALLLFVGLILTPITLLGALIFYKRGFRVFMEPNNEFPRLNRLSPILKVAMVIGAILIWGIIYLTAQVMIRLILWIGGDVVKYNPSFIPVFLIVNIVFTALVWFWFSKWRGGTQKYVSEKQRFGSARTANDNELLPYRKPQGFYIGFNTFYKKAGHLLTVAGTRAGKGVNLILQNLLMPGLFEKMSFVVIDPKGELAAISANAQRKAGRKVIILNPWNLLSLVSKKYNPLDILKSDPLNVADDVQMIAESIVPTGAGNEEDHFQDRARTFVSTLLLHLVTAAPEEDRHLETLWKWLRLGNEEWLELLAAMMLNDDPHVGDIVKAGANEIAGLMKNSDREYGSVISSAQKCTDFIKSPALRDSLKGADGFTSADLASGNVTVYVCIPFDRLKSHNAWLRLVVTSLMRSVVRNPKEKVCFLIDEAYAFGYHSEIDMALGAYAGFGIHVWLIYQSLVQIKKIFGDNWENLVANCSVRHFFNISDNFSADYMSHLFGTTSVPNYDDKGNITGATARPLVTPDELRRESGQTIYTVIDQLAPAQIPKVPYYMMGLDCDPNPYYKPEINN